MTNKEQKLCDSCKNVIVELLEKRIRRVLTVYRKEGYEDGHAEGICFHLMEVQRMIQGKGTSGVFDDAVPEKAPGTGQQVTK